MKKYLDFYCFVTLYDFLSLKNDVNVPSKRNKHKNFKKIIFWWHLQGHWRKEQDPEPDPLVKDTDPRIRIRIQMSRIRNTITKKYLPFDRYSGPTVIYPGNKLSEKLFYFTSELNFVQAR
jgi:hypothetical protein